MKRSRAGTTVDDVVRALADAIINGQWLPGQKLDEFTLAARFGLSRTPIREALGQLVAMGLVDKRPNKGAVVAEVSKERLSSMFEAMAELEGVCARLAAKRMTKVERYTFEASHLASLQFVHTRAAEEYSAHNTSFHTAIYLGAHNEHLLDIVTATRSRLAPFRRAQFRLPDRLMKSHAEHSQIVTAILQGDGAAAEIAARNHVATVSDASSSLVESARQRTGSPETVD